MGAINLSMALFCNGFFKDSAPFSASAIYNVC